MKRLIERAVKMSLIIGTILSMIGSIHLARAESALDGPVTALAAAGDRLLIGQDSRLIEAKIAADQLQVVNTHDFAAGAIRSIAIRPDGSTLILTESTLFLLNASDSVIDSVSTGGQQIVLSGDQIYIAALEAGVRRFQIANDKLTPIVAILTSAPAMSIALQGANRLWIAEGAGGLWEYAIADPTPPAPIFGDKNDVTAALVRVIDPYLIVGYGNQVGVLTTNTSKFPRLISHFAIGDTASAGEALLTANGSLLIGRIDAGGADLALYPLNGSKSDGQPIAQFGNSGAGEQIVQVGDQFFYGSIRAGLQRISLNGTQFTPITAWNPGSAAPCTLADYTPLVPQPINRGSAAVANDGTITLNWQAACAADQYVVQINGQPIATVTQQSFSYTPPNSVGVVHWQVIAHVNSASGVQTVSGPRWTLAIAATGLLAIPRDPDLSAVLYVVPSPFGRGLTPQTPLGTILLVGGLGVIGVLVIIIGAWLIGLTSSRLRARR